MDQQGKIKLLLRFLIYWSNGAFGQMKPWVPIFMSFLRGVKKTVLSVFSSYPRKQALVLGPKAASNGTRTLSTTSAI